MSLTDLYAEAKKQGVALEELAQILTPLARDYFGPDLRVEVVAEDGRVTLFAAFWIKQTSGPGALAIDRVRLDGMDVQLDDELVFQIFFSPDEGPEARAQDAQYLALIGLSSVGCGFWPVARHALEKRLGVEQPSRAARQFAFARAIGLDAQFVLRRTDGFELVVKELVEVRAGGEIEPFAHGRRDLAPGSIVEVTRRTVSAEEVLEGLAKPGLASEVSELAPEQRRVFDWVVKHLRSRNVLVAHVAHECEGRFIPSG